MQPLLSCLQRQWAIYIDLTMGDEAYHTPDRQLCSAAAAAIARVGSLADCRLVAEDGSSCKVSKAVVAVHSSVLAQVVHLHLSGCTGVKISWCRRHVYVCHSSVQPVAVEFRKW